MHPRTSSAFAIAVASMLVLSFPPCATAAGAATVEDGYIAARNVAIAKLKAAVDAEKRGPTDGYSDKILAMEKEARAALERQMRAIVGPIAIKGLQGKGALNLDTLFEGDESFGVLDGMSFASADDKTSVIVTTDGLLHRWLVEHKEWWGKDKSDMPQAPVAAVKEAAFYSQAMVTDSAVMRFAVLPLRKPSGVAFAFAMLAARTQDEVPPKADEIYIAVARGGHVFIGRTQRFAPVGLIASCDAIRAEWVKKSVEAAEKQRPKNAAGDEEPDRLRAKSETEFLHCFSAEAARQQDYAAAVKAAQRLIDDVLQR